jgi:hypothetical protein
MPTQIFVTAPAIFVKNLMKNKICAVKIINFINISRTFVVIFMILEKKFVCIICPKK